MDTISIRALSDHSFEVRIDARHSTVHVVTVRPEYAARLLNGNATTEMLVRKSFEFLLARESNSSILRSFDLSVIARYFPEYEQEIVRQLS
ncbi:MAG TPA: hypothetical protein VIK69_05905 [Methylophilaceae bacterium]|jgi:hypothetical protein